MTSTGKTTVALTTTTAKIRISVETTEKKEVVSTIKRTEILKYTCFHLIPYIHSPVIGLFPHRSMATMTTFPGTSPNVKKTNWVE